MSVSGGDGVKVTRSLFQEREGSAIPTSPLKFRVVFCEFSEIRHIFERFHYKGGHMGGGISFCFRLEYRGYIVGGAVCGKLRQENFYSKNGRKTLEIRRMALLDDCPKNSESYFLGKILWLIKKYTDIEEVISYADKSVGHVGTIYKAANFKMIGETSPSIHVFWNGKRYHPRSLTIERAYSYQLRDAVKRGDATVEKGEPKLIYSYQINRGK